MDPKAIQDIEQQSFLLGWQEGKKAGARMARIRQAAPTFATFFLVFALGATVALIVNNVGRSAICDAPLHLEGF